MSTCRRRIAALRQSALDRPSDELRALLRFEADRAATLLRAGEVLRARIGGRLGRAVGALRPRRPGRARSARVGGLGHVHAAAEAVARPTCARGGARSRPMSSVDEAYAEVQRVTRARAKNFAYGIMVLPREKRRAIAAIYAFAREVDDVADGDLPLEEKRRQLEALRRSLDEAPSGAMSVALHDARRGSTFRATRWWRSSTAACRTSSRRATRRSTTCAAMREGRRRGRSRVYRGVRLGRRERAIDARDRAAVDQHHA